MTGAFTLGAKTGYRIKRFDLLDRIVKGKLKELKESGTIIKASFRIINFGIPFLLLFTCFLPVHVSTYASYLALVLIGLITTVWRFWRKHLGLALRFGLYLLIPYIIYTGNMDTVSWVTAGLMRYYSLSFFVFAIFIVLTMKFSRRQQGFKSTPLDLLILFLAIVVPNLPVEEIQSYHLGLVATKIITLFFSYEVLMGELREKFGKLTLFTIVSLGVIFVKGLL